ncbi:MAG: acyl-CoA carboxylase subunit beta [Planctomycetales bacterium]|nr:acyl-CoA carboxylase subunit beta [Planctomycetales bacterium]NIM09270.1 acyl-CoA carboxylase subunit beta [Planctomycetales bacterium]NIN08738.1 acyl-CoA carboxylase subunit beta [Planctomycetales bacterium]NIN77857.1 acyl-CoA carboxylase subunit beta [Planctomycetales bacterium]NIO35040.1 acyl-CoA carboxylase subunit beta [Planctomycetales bacterium]
MSSPSHQSLADRTARMRAQQQQLAEGGGAEAVERQHGRGRLTARERIERLLDPGTPSLELGLWAGWQMYDAFGGAPGAGVVTVLGNVAGRCHLIAANDATVKAGAFFPATTKKLLRAQRIALINRVPLIYLVDSAGVFLPLQEDVFPDEDDFGRIFRNNAVLSAAGVPQVAAIMGNCVAGGGYLPVLCDKTLMTEGSGLYLAGPALVKSAIGQEVSHEELGGAEMHARISGTIDYREPDDESCLRRIRELAAVIHPDATHPAPPYTRQTARPALRPGRDLYNIVSPDPRVDYEVRDVLECLLDEGSFQEYKAEYGQTLVCGTARIDGFPVGIVANQHHQVRPAAGPIQFGGVLYVDSAEKAARFVMNCNQDWLPIVFLHDVNGFMVGRSSEEAGIIKAGAKLVNAVSNSRVAKITVIIGGSFGAGNYAQCGKAYDPRFIFAWPTARCAVMGADQATSTLLDVTVRSLQRQGSQVDADELAELRDKIRGDYDRQTDVRYAAARGWVDAIIDPAETREILAFALQVATRHAEEGPLQWGVFQV